MLEVTVPEFCLSTLEVTVPEFIRGLLEVTGPEFIRGLPEVTLPQFLQPGHESNSLILTANQVFASGNLTCAA
jgi:hypothetical protein